MVHGQKNIKLEVIFVADVLIADSGVFFLVALSHTICESE